MTVRQQQVKVAHHIDRTTHQHISGENADNATSKDYATRITGKISTQASRTEINITVTMITVVASFGILMFPSNLMYLVQLVFQVGYASVATHMVDYVYDLFYFLNKFESQF
jgi:hypothetical protein